MCCMRTFYVIPIFCLSGLIHHGSIAQKALEIGIGAAPWHESHIIDASNKLPPIQAYVEYGSFMEHYSMTLIYDWYSKYKLDNYTLSPQFFGLLVNRKIGSFDRYHHIIEFGGSGGLLLEMHKFKDRGNSNVPGYSFETETATGIGYILRVYGKLIIKNFSFTPQFQFLRSQQNFLAGQFEQQTFQTGSNRFLISIGYRLNFENYAKVTCPTYY